MATIVPAKTEQRSKCRPILKSHDGVGNFLVWTATDTKQNLCFYFRREGMTFGGDLLSPNGERCSNYGPDLIVLPDGFTAYIVWANKSGVIKITKLARSAATDNSWKVVGADISVSGSNAASGPCAALGQQNNHIVLNVLWQDSTKDAIAFTQLPIGSEAPPSSLDMEVLETGLKASSTPIYGRMQGRGSFLAFFDQKKTFNLAFDPDGGLRFGSPQMIEGISSNWSPAFVPTARDQGYVFWVDVKKVPEIGTVNELRYQQVGALAKRGDWARNPLDAAKGTITGSEIIGPPFAQLVDLEDSTTKSTQKGIRLTWPKYRSEPYNGEIVYTTEVPISYAAMPVVIVTSI